MGRRDRERRERIEAGLEKPLRNPMARKAVALASRRGVIDELSKGTVTDQTDRLSELVGTGTLPEQKLRQAVMKNAPKEMDKAIKKFRKQGKPITVDSLCTEIRSEQGFLRMCEQVGLSLEWFEDLARERMKASGVEV